MPAAVERLLERALSRSPADRPASASQFVNELADAANGSLVVARRALELPASFSDRPPEMDEETPLAVDIGERPTEPESILRPVATPEVGDERVAPVPEETAREEAPRDETPPGVEARPIRQTGQPTRIIARTEPAMIETPVMAETPPEEPAMVEPAMVGVVERAMADPVGPDGPAPDAQSAAELTRQANDLALRGRLPEAIDLYTLATRRAPRYAPAWRGLGIANERMQRRPEARQAFERYLELAEHAPDAERIRARLGGL